MERVLLVDYEYRDERLVKSLILGAPSAEQKWVIHYWAKQGNFTHSLTIDCEEPMHADEFIPFAVEKVGTFIEEALKARDALTLALRLEGKQFKAKRIEDAISRYGYKAYYEPVEEHDNESETITDCSKG